MSISVLGMDGNAWTPKDMDASANNKVTTYHLLGFAGSYVTGGDTLDLSAIAAQIPTGSLPDQIMWEGNGPGSSFTGQGGYLQIAKGATLANNKMKSFAGGGGESAANTYASLGHTTDVITLAITWKKLGQS